MRVAVVHGYFLGDSGSGVYVRQVTEALVREGHDVTLVCQEREPERYDFIGSAWTLDATNTALTPLAGAGAGASASSPAAAGASGPAAAGPGTCRLVRPNLGGRLLVYVDGPFAGFPRSGVMAFQDAPREWIDSFLAENIAALRTIFDRWSPDVVLAQHTLAQPHIVREALRGRCPYTVSVHGSELNFSLKRDARLAPLGISGLEGAQAVVALTRSSLDDVIDWAADHDLDIAGKSHVLPPGVDTDTFTPSPSRSTAIAALRDSVGLPAGFDLSPDDEVLAFAGRVGWNKGIQHAVVALSLVSAVRPRVRLLVAGDGPARDALERLAERLSAGDVAGARALAETDEELRTTDEYGPLVPDGIGAVGPARVAYLGHLTAADVARMFATADIALAPSIFPEAAALVTSEALSCGALPVVAYHTGLAALADLERDTLGDEAFRELAPGVNLSESIAAVVTRQLDRYPTGDLAFRQRLHGIAVDRFPTWRGVAARYVELGLAE